MCPLHVSRGVGCAQCPVRNLDPPEDGQGSLPCIYVRNSEEFRQDPRILGSGALLVRQDIVPHRSLRKERYQNLKKCWPNEHDTHTPHTPKNERRCCKRCANGRGRGAPRPEAPPRSEVQGVRSIRAGTSQRATQGSPNPVLRYSPRLLVEQLLTLFGAFLFLLVCVGGVGGG